MPEGKKYFPRPFKRVSIHFGDAIYFNDMIETKKREGVNEKQLRIEIMKVISEKMLQLSQETPLQTYKM